MAHTFCLGRIKRLENKEPPRETVRRHAPRPLLRAAAATTVRPGHLLLFAGAAAAAHSYRIYTIIISNSTSPPRSAEFTHNRTDPCLLVVGRRPPWGTGVSVLRRRSKPGPGQNQIDRLKPKSARRSLNRAATTRCLNARRALIYFDNGRPGVMITVTTITVRGRSPSTKFCIKFTN